MKTGVLLVNLGTPDSPATSDVRKYLTEFLNDPLVIDIHPIARFFLVNLIIVPFRSAKSAKLYKEIWREDGKSPLLYYTEKQHELFSKLMGEKYDVQMAMRYQSPSLNKALDHYKKQGTQKLIVFPLFPQYASASTRSVIEKVNRIVAKWKVKPEIEFINSFCDQPDFIKSFAELGNKYEALKNYDHVLMSFHGLPERQIKKLDTHDHCLKNGCCDTLSEVNELCYRAQCYQTARKLATEMNLPKEKYTVCFQSRLGKDPWIKPYSDEVIKERAAKGDKKMLVFAPAFTADCLETLYEISIEYNDLFKEHGGEKIQLVESLNDSPKWIEAMKTIIRQ